MIENDFAEIWTEFTSFPSLLEASRAFCDVIIFVVISNKFGEEACCLQRDL